MKRKPLQGLVTILRFNWHFFAIALVGIVAILLAAPFLPSGLRPIAIALAAGASLVVATTIVATTYAYDLSGLYSLRWLDSSLSGSSRAANIHAGFDETSALLRQNHPSVTWSVFDFYDPSKHTEISIRRARAAQPPDPSATSISTHHIPLEDRSLDRVILMLAAHEIRDRSERVTFFKEIIRVLQDQGRVILTEHLRDLPNICAYTLGAWHFHTRAEWLETIRAAGFVIISETKTNLLITTFILGKHGTAP